MSLRYHGIETIILLLLAFSGRECRAQAGPPAGERSWNRVQYHGGAAGSEGTSTSWNNYLTISAKAITLKHDQKVLFEFAPDSVIALNYQGVRCINGKDIAISTATTGAIGLVAGLLNHQKEHYLAIEYTLPDGRQSAVLLRLDKGNYREIQDALHAVTGIHRVEKKPPA